jgi:hypothetical protein
MLAPQIDAAKEYQAGRNYLRTLPMPETQDLAALDAAHQAATAQNTADWSDNDSQRATNQHLIDVAFGQKTQDVTQTKANLNQAVNDWLDQPGQTQRPPLSIWVRLDPDQQQAADLRLAQNAQGAGQRLRPGFPGRPEFQKTGPGCLRTRIKARSTGIPAIAMTVCE